MLSQWARLQEQVFSVFRVKEQELLPADEMAALTELIHTGAFDLLDEEARRNRACRIGVLGERNFALSGQALVALGRLLHDQDAIVRWDAAFSIVEIAKKHPLVVGDALIMLQGMLAAGVDAELRAMTMIGIRDIRLHKRLAAPAIP